MCPQSAANENAQTRKQIAEPVFADHNLAGDHSAVTQKDVFGGMVLGAQVLIWQKLLVTAQGAFVGGFSQTACHKGDPDQDH